jgi:serine protease Do
MASSFGYQKASGILIGDVVRDGPAAKTGLKRGDIVTSLEGKPVTNVTTFRNRVAQIKPGSKVSLEIWREGNTRKVDVEVGEMPAQYGGADSTSRLSDLGLEMGDLTTELREKAKLDGGAKGALIVGVAPGSMAEAAGLRSGDLIVEIQGQKITSPEDANRELSRTDVKKGVRLYIERGNEGGRFVFLKSN